MLFPADDFRLAWTILLCSERQGADKAKAAPERTAWQQDFDRIVFSSAFRRLKDKTQVFPLSKSDYVRTRLTHSLETSCVGRSLGVSVGRAIIAEHGLKQVDAADFGAIVAAACLAHDIGNPPFGHAGEDAIRDWFLTSGYLEANTFTPAQINDLRHYEGNAQGFRVLTRLASPANPGLRLTAAVLVAAAKYPCDSRRGEGRLDGASVRKFGYFQADAETFAATAQAVGLPERAPGVWRRHPLSFLVEAADDICYLIVDLEDAARLGVVGEAQAEELLTALAGPNLSRLSSFGEPRERIEYLRAKAIGNLIEESTEVFLAHERELLQGSFDQPLTQLLPSAGALAAVEKLAREKIYVARDAIAIEIAGFEVLGGLLSLFAGAVEAAARQNRPSTKDKMLLSLLPAQFLGPNGRPDPDPYLRLLQIADFVSGMTDSYAVDLFRTLKGIERP
ncbi:MAG: dNTP triphosphohydrolase [Zoogloeaceae bacterium]|jgi:dGTPase|nr:dNTP triphosphohydrolase [Zoogloeaceae bacterium]